MSGPPHEPRRQRLEKITPTDMAAIASPITPMVRKTSAMVQSLSNAVKRGVMISSNPRQSPVDFCLPPRTVYTRHLDRLC